MTSQAEFDTEGDVRSANFGRKKTWRPISMSLLTHFLLVVFLIALGYSAGSQGTPDQVRRGGIVLTAQTEENETEYLTPEDLPQNNSESATSAAAAPASSDAPPALASPVEPLDRPEFTGAEAVESTEFDANQMANVPAKVNSNAQYQLTEQDLRLIRADRRFLKSQEPIGDPVTVRVFGSGGLTGRSFAFVIDRSQSMGSSGLDVIYASRKQLSAAINQLESHHLFQIIGYHETTTVVSKNRRMLNATDENKNAVPKFIDSLTAYGATNHKNGLVAALAFKPDVIVLMTDGGYPELNSTELKMMNRFAEGCQIHCIQFGLGPLQTKINFMTRLAEQNNGTFKYIDVREMRKQNK
ncbi:MAG: hypothetical protein AB8B55_05050 [Mariniblastus sp.]